MYVIYRQDKGFLCEDEDSLDGTSYCYYLDMYTVFFNTLEDAKLNVRLGENILKLEFAEIGNSN